MSRFHSNGILKVYWINAWRTNFSINYFSTCLSQEQPMYNFPFEKEESGQIFNFKAIGVMTDELPAMLEKRQEGGLKEKYSYRILYNFIY